MSDQGSYQVEMNCVNCEKEVSVDIPRGVRVADFDGECPRCGCVDVLSRIANTQILPKRFDPNRHEWRPAPPPYPWQSPFVVHSDNTSPPPGRVVEINVTRDHATLDRLKALASSHSIGGLH